MRAATNPWKAGCNNLQQKLASGFWHIQARPESGTERLAVASGFVGIRYAIVDSRLSDDVGGVGPILLVVLSVLYVGAMLSERLARAVHTAAERAGPFLHLWPPPPFVWRSWLLQAW